MHRMSITAGLGMCIGDQSNPTAVRSHSRRKAVLFDVRATVPVDGLYLYHLRPFPTLIEGSGVSPRHNSVHRASESRLRSPRLPFFKGRWIRRTADEVEIYCKTLNICLAIISRHCLPRVSEIPHYHLYLLIELHHSTPPPSAVLVTYLLLHFTLPPDL